MSCHIREDDRAKFVCRESQVAPGHEIGNGDFLGTTRGQEASPNQHPDDAKYGTCALSHVWWRFE